MRSYWVVQAERGLTLDPRDVPQPAPKEGQLLVKVRASSFNRGELLTGHGAYNPNRQTGRHRVRGRDRRARRRRHGFRTRRSRHGPLRRRFRGLRAHGRARRATGACAFVVGASRRDSARVHGHARHADRARPPEARRVAADHGRVVRRRRRLAASGQSARRQGHRHVGVGGEARQARATRARRRRRHARRRLPRAGAEGHRRQGRRPRRQHGRRHGLRGMRQHARLSKAAWRRSAISIAP